MKRILYACLTLAFAASLASCAGPNKATHSKCQANKTNNHKPQRSFIY